MIEDRGRVRASTAPDPRDQSAAEQIWRNRSYAGQTFDEGQFVALIGGRIVAVGWKLGDVETALAQAESEPLVGLIVEVAEPAVDIIRACEQSPPALLVRLDLHQ